MLSPTSNRLPAHHGWRHDRSVLTVVTRSFLTVALAAAVCGCQPDRLGATRGYVLISLDTLSAEHMSLHGYHRLTTPFLARLAERSMVFDNAFVQLPGTLPSHMSMMTGLYPDQHGMIHTDGVLSERIATLPEIFHAQGFRTAGFTEGGYVSGRYGFSRGFEQYDDSFGDFWRTKPDVFDSGLGFIESVAADEPFFLFVHTYAVHAPYTPPEECRDLFWPDEAPAVDPPLGPNLREHNEGLAVIDRATADYYAALYDAEIRCLDTRLETFFAALEEMGIADDVTVVVTSDHGEEFLDHGMMVHRQIYVENTHVPLMLVHPAFSRGRRIPGIVQSIDIAPTLYDIAGLEPPLGMSGRSLLPVIEGRVDQVRDFAVSQSSTGDRGLVAPARDRLFHLLSFHPDFDPPDKPFGAASFLRLRVPRGKLLFKATACPEPTTVSLTVDGVELREVPLDTGVWSQVEAEVPSGAGQALLELLADSCQPTPQSLEHGSRRCLSFRVRGLPVRRFELYDLVADRRETIDLSADDEDLTSRLAVQLRELRWEAVAPTHDVPIDDELQNQLRALGYLVE